jgi:hypothetical protein
MPGKPIRDQETAQLSSRKRIHNPVSRRTTLRLLSGSAAFALISSRAVSDTLLEDTFKQTVIALLNRRHPDWHVDSGKNPQTIKIGISEVYLDNIYRQVRDLPSSQRDGEIVASTERALAEREVSTDKSEFAATSNLIRPQIVPADYLQQAGDPVHRVFLAGLLVAYAVDDKHPPTLGSSGRCRSDARSRPMRSNRLRRRPMSPYYGGQVVCWQRTGASR